MNKDRRKRLEALSGRLEDVRTELQDIIDEIDAIKEEEQEAYDNLPESLQESERGCTMQENIDSLDYAIDIDFDTVIDDIDGYIQEVIER